MNVVAGRRAKKDGRTGEIVPISPDCARPPWDPGPEALYPNSHLTSTRLLTPHDFLNYYRCHAFVLRTFRSRRTRWLVRPPHGPIIQAGEAQASVPGCE
jgi:hypothetical protein